jgi:signal transduction histidine kinase
VLLAFFAYAQYQAYLDDIKTTRKQILLNNLQGRIAYLDEALTMSASSFVMTRNTEWNERYKTLQNDYYASVSQIYTLLPGSFDGKKEMDASNSRLMDMEDRAFGLVRLDHVAEARSLLFGKEYLQQKAIYSLGKEKLTETLNAAESKLIALHYKEAKKAAFIRGGIVLLLLSGWWWFMHTSKKWQHMINEANHERAEEAVAAAKKLTKANDQLRLLSEYLQEVREKERLTLANELNEELGQQIAALKIRIMNVQKNLSATDKTRAEELQQVSDQLGRLLHFSRELASDVYPLVLRDLGLVEALEWESERVSSPLVHVSFYSDLEHLQVDQRAATHLFRLYQEKLQSLISIGATEIMGSLRVENNHLLLSIHDNADLALDKENKSIEDVAIKERVRSIKGHSEINTLSKEGNSFTISIPYQADLTEPGIYHPDSRSN